MESGAKGCEVSVPMLFYGNMFHLLMIGECISIALFIQIQVIVSGKLRAQRAKSMKFKDGYMISSGQPVNEYIDSAVRHVLLRQVCLL